MKLLFDENLSPLVVRSLTDLFPGSAHVRDFGLAGGEDWEIWNYAASNGFVIASKDSDFRQRSLLQGQPPKIIVVAIGNCTNERLETLFRNRFEALTRFEADPTLAMLVLR